MVDFHALGGVAVTDDDHEVGIGGPRQRRLLAVLLIHRNSVVSVDRLADAVFAGEPTPAASTTLRSYVARIRKAVEGDGSEPVVVTRAPGYVLRVCDDAFDVARFEHAVGEGRSLLARDDPLAAAVVLRDGLALWRGDAYAEFDDEDWARPEADRLAELRLVAQELLFEAELAGGHAGELIPELEASVRQHPLRESFVAQLMLARYRSGRQADALRAYQAHRDVLVEELGLDPTPSLQQLEERILRQDPDLLVGEPGERALRGYRLGERLGTGQDGTVHAAHLPGVGRDLVIRTVRAELADSPAFVRAFEATAQRIRDLRHPAIVPIHDYWREPGAAHVVMRRMHGGSLADRLERLDRRPLTDAEVIQVVRRVGSALAAAADAGLAHGRVRPSNVLFDEAGEAWLTDFDLGGCARAAADVADLSALVRACVPEARGDLAAVLDRAHVEPDRPVADHVAALVEALTGQEADDRAPLPNPYMGLRAFDESDAADFFGRADLVDDVLRRLGGTGPRSRLVLVVGGSGTGKSSVVRAGILPRIRRGAVPGSEGWFVTTMLPGATPFKELAAALRRVAVTEVPDLAGALAGTGGIDAVVRQLLPPGGQLLLVVDQLEELFTSAPERDQRRFLDGLVHAIGAPDSRLRVVGTLRADFYDRPLGFHAFGAAVNDATVTIPAMSAVELEAAIVEPAHRSGRQVEGALVAELVSAAVNEPAALPSLQFALFELAERNGRDLTLASYQELGGLSGAIATRAEALYRSLDDADRGAVRRLFGELVVVHADGEPTRRRASRIELTADDPGLDPVIDRWTEARLLSLDRHRQSRMPTVEPAHEALLREWPRLRGWLEDDRHALLVRTHLREAAASWDELDREPGGLYRGARLQIALDALHASTLAPVERAFIDASRGARDAEEQEAAAQAERQARANRRLRAQLVVIVGALVIALVGGLVAQDQRDRALDERRTAFARELAAAADASLDEDPERSMLLALAAVETDRDGGRALPEAIGALHHAVSRTRILLSVPGLGGALDWHPDGSVFVTEGPEDTGIVDVRDARTGESVRTWTGDDIDINEVAFDGTGDLLATAGDDGHLRVWETGSGDAVAEVDLGADVWGPSFSPDGRLVAAASVGDRQAVHVIDVATGEELFSVERPTVFGTDFSPDGERLVTASIAESGLVVLSARTGDEVLRFGDEHPPSRDARHSPDGRWIASAHQDGIVRIWDAATGEQRFTIAEHSSEANALDWSQDSSRLATAGNDGTARVHEVTDGGVRQLVAVSARDTSNGIGAVAFSPDADRILTGDWAVASAKIWDVSERAGAEWTNLRSVPYSLGSGSFLGDGDTVIALDDRGHIVRWDVESGDPVGHIDPVDPAGVPVRMAPSPDGELVLAGLEDGLALYDVASGELEAQVTRAQDGWPIDMAWSPDGQHLAVALGADDGGEILVADRSGTEVTRIREESDYFARTVTFSADGNLLVTARGVPRQAPGIVGVRVWDWATGEPALDIAELATDAAADPTGDRIVFAKELTGTAEIWDLSTGRRVRTLRGAGAAYGVSWSGDGERIALAGADGTVRVFEADSGRLDVILRGHERAVSSVSFSPVGARIASLDEGGMVRVWTLDLDELIGIASSRLTRTLDDEECRQYLRRDRCETG
jgi:WD40 repeat protein/DNA-binding SARP family transcriptional activator